MSGGSCRAALEIAAWTSWAAASRSRVRLNWSVICVLPERLVDVIESRPAMVENWLSSGVATAEAIVSGLAPGQRGRYLDRREIDVRAGRSPAAAGTP